MSSEHLNEFLKQWRQELSSRQNIENVNEESEPKSETNNAQSTPCAIVGIGNKPLPSIHNERKRKTLTVSISDLPKPLSPELEFSHSKKLATSFKLTNASEKDPLSDHLLDKKSARAISSNIKRNSAAFNYVNSLFESVVDSPESVAEKCDSKITSMNEQHHIVDMKQNDLLRINQKNDDKYLDLFLADLDEINDIPFFDLTIPREVAMNIFKNFDIVDLCRCAQVSKSWRSLAEDDLLWCRACHQLGYELNSQTVDRNYWKSRAKELFLRDKSLIHNWKNRLGRYEELSYVQGGILCAADSRDGLVVGGYTNGQLSVWNLDTGVNQIYDPSSISLMIDETRDSGTLNNHVTSVKMGADLVAALYSQGIVDVWKLDGDINPVFTSRTNLTKTSCLVCHRDQTKVAYSFDRQVKLVDFNLGNDGLRHTTNVLDFGQNIQWMKYVPNTESLCLQTGCIIRLATPGVRRENLPTLHELADSFVSCADLNEDVLSVGITSYGLLDGCKVQIYDITCGRLMTSLSGFYGMDLKCMNTEDSPENMIITGGADRKVYVHDLRQSQPVLTLSPNLSLSQLQMDELKVVVNGFDGQTCVYDLRTRNKLWEFHNRHPVAYSRFSKHHLVTANVPQCKYPDDGSCSKDGDHMTHKRFRGGIHVYDFSITQETEGIPSICKSSYSSQAGYSYNINLATPYDQL